MMIGRNVSAKNIALRIREGSIGAELGVWKGDTSEIILPNCKKLHLVDSWSVVPYKKSPELYFRLIDRYKNMIGSEDPADFQRYYDGIYESVMKRFKKYDKRVIIHRMTTDQWFKTLNEKLDFIYVDASHDKEGCLKDLNNSLKSIKKGGKLLGDDYGTKDGVTDAVNEFVKSNNLKIYFYGHSQYEINV